MKHFSLPGFNLDLGSLWQHSVGLAKFNPLPMFQRAEKNLSEKFLNETLGFYHWPEKIPELELLEIQSLAKELKSKFQGALICGIGGSHLGAASILEALGTTDDERSFPIFWLNNVDRNAMEKARAFVSERKVATLLISKSGNTIETLSGFFHLSPYLDPDGIVIITDPKTGELRRWVNDHHYRSLPVPTNIGGRFSVLTSVGLLPLALGGINITKVLQGAQNLKKHLTSLSLENNPAYFYALSSFWWDREENHNIQYLMPYQSQLKLLTDWYVQLWAESLGKKDAHGNAVGPTFVGALGSRDQHSLLQLFKEGPNNKLIGFMDLAPPTDPLLVGRSPVSAPQFDYLTGHSFEELSSKALLATQQSLESAKVPTYSFQLNALTPETLGAFILFQEFACAIAGEFYQVNAFNQPGVEEAKQLLRSSL